MDIAAAITLLAALAIAVITDLRSQRIPNWLTFPLMLSGLVAHAVANGLDGLLFALAGFGLGLGVMLVPFLLGMMGAGDVKLMAGVGAWLGASTAFAAFIFTCLVGGVYALVVLLRHMDHLKAVLANFRASVFILLSSHRFEYVPVKSERVLPRLCYGVAIAAGTLASMGLAFHRTGLFYAP
jgi:prepilin peptidase CpaA